MAYAVGSTAARAEHPSLLIKPFIIMSCTISTVQDKGLFHSCPSVTSVTAILPDEDENVWYAPALGHGSPLKVSNEQPPCQGCTAPPTHSLLHPAPPRAAPPRPARPPGHGWPPPPPPQPWGGIRLRSTFLGEHCFTHASLLTICSMQMVSRKHLPVCWPHPILPLGSGALADSNPNVSGHSIEREARTPSRTDTFSWTNATPHLAARPLFTPQVKVVPLTVVCCVRLQSLQRTELI